MFVKDWSRYKNFSEDEFRCSHSGQAYMQIEFMDKMQSLRTDYNRIMKVSSGYRSPQHPIEASKVQRGEHTYGACADIQCSPNEAYELLALAHKHGFKRIGINQTGPYAARFIHLGIGFDNKFPLNVIWTYK